VCDARRMLGVTADADPAQLARAYRRQARRLHPDLSREPDATEQFWRLQAAYHVALAVARNDATPAEPSVPVEHRGRTVVLGAPPSSDVLAGTWFGRGGVAWFAAGPVRVQRSERLDPGAAATPSGGRA
jgi:hypothetical protein